MEREIDDGATESCHLLQAETLPNIGNKKNLNFMGKILSVKDLFSLCVEKKEIQKK